MVAFAEPKTSSKSHKNPISRSGSHSRSLKTPYPRSKYVRTGLRFYSPSLHTWPNRDPLGEIVALRGVPPWIVADQFKNQYCFVNNNGISQIDSLGLVSEGDSCDPCTSKPCNIRLFTVIDNGTSGTSVKARVLSLLTEGDCQDLHYTWFDCCTGAGGPTDADFAKTIPRTDINLHVAANLSFLSCEAL
jgi:hypothetical protein